MSVENASQPLAAWQPSNANPSLHPSAYTQPRSFFGNNVRYILHYNVDGENTMIPVVLEVLQLDSMYADEHNDVDDITSSRLY